jgi:hypothetical protein
MPFVGSGSSGFLGRGEIATNIFRTFFPAGVVVRRPLHEARA